MKLGAENKKSVIALAIVGPIAALALWYTFSTPSTPGAANAVVVPATATAPAVRINSLDPKLHMDRLDALRAINYTGTGRDLFHFGSAPALAQAQPASQKPPAHVGPVMPPPPPIPTGPPPPPPIPLKFYGFADSANAPEKIFLQMGDDNYVVAQGDTIEHRYLIVNIGKVSVRVKDLQTNSEQELPLQQG
ncbi:MAG TPA: hypothetical protein VIC32_02315 [Terriglobales bacterium]|jgi:hypothetical protein